MSSYNLFGGIAKREGFRPVVYIDTLGFETIGHGLKMPLLPDELELIANDRVKRGLSPDMDVLRITEDESMIIVRKRVESNIKALIKRKPFIKNLSNMRYLTVIEMSYQLGVDGLLGFPSMLKALEEGDFQRASDEILYKNGITKTEHSDLYKQTTGRCKNYARVIREGA